MSKLIRYLKVIENRNATSTEYIEYLSTYITDGLFSLDNFSSSKIAPANVLHFYLSTKCVVNAKNYMNIGYKEGLLRVDNFHLYLNLRITSSPPPCHSEWRSGVLACGHGHHTTSLTLLLDATIHVESPGKTDSERDRPKTRNAEKSGLPVYRSA